MKVKKTARMSTGGRTPIKRVGKAKKPLKLPPHLRHQQSRDVVDIDGHTIVAAKQPYWMKYPRLHEEPWRIKPGVQINCEWDADEDGNPQYYPATIVKRSYKNYVVITFNEDPLQTEYCLRFRGGKDTATDRKRDMIFTLLFV